MTILSVCGGPAERYSNSTDCTSHSYRKDLGLSFRGSLCRTSAFRRLSYLLLLQCHFVGNIVFVDTADVPYGLLADVLCSHQLHIAEPDIGIESFLFCLFSQPYDSIRTGVICSECEQCLVRGRDSGIIEIGSSDLCQHFGACVDV